MAPGCYRGVLFYTDFILFAHVSTTGHKNVEKGIMPKTVQTHKLCHYATRRSSVTSSLSMVSSAVVNNVTRYKILPHGFMRNGRKKKQ